MSKTHLSKNLQPIRKGWKSFTNRLKSKLRDTNLGKTLTTLGQHFTSIWRSTFLIIHRKSRSLTHRSPPHYSRLHLHHHQYRPNFSAIYVDELFPGPGPLVGQMNTKEKVVASSTNAKTRPGLVIANHNVEKLRQGVEKESVKVSGRHEKRLAAGKGKEKAGESASKNYAADGKKNIPNSLPQFRGIDERAEDFINKFRQDMKLEREQSILEFQEMLKRSA